MAGGVSLLTIAMMGSGCGQANEGAPEGGRVTGPSTENIAVYDQPSYDRAWSRFLATTRPAPAGGYWVEWDRYVPSEQALKTYFDEAMNESVDKAHAITRTSTGFIDAYSRNAAMNLRYCVSSSFGAAKSTWVTRMADATRAWELQTAVRFTYLSGQDSACTGSNANVDFAVVRFDGVGGYCATNKLVWAAYGGCPINSGGTQNTGVLVIDTVQDMTFGGTAPNVTPTGAIRHELGHMLGFRHEHPWRSPIGATCNLETPNLPSSDLTGTQLGTISYDQQSVMHYPFATCGGNTASTFSLSLADGFSIQRLYGMQPAWHTSDVLL